MNLREPAPTMPTNSNRPVRRYILLHGPLSGMGGWSFERHNGVLSRVKNNKMPGIISQTLLHNWIMQSRLLAIISNPAPDASPTELAALERIRGKNVSERNGITTVDPVGGGVRRMNL